MSHARPRSRSICERETFGLAGLRFTLLQPTRARFHRQETTMLDESISQQLREVFGSLEARYSLVVRPSKHEKQAELLELARGVAATSDKIDVKVEGEETS